MDEQLQKLRQEFDSAWVAFDNAAPEYVDVAIHRLRAAELALSNYVREQKAVCPC